MKQGDQMDESMKMDHSKHDHHEMNHSMNGHDHHNMNQEMSGHDHHEMAHGKFQTKILALTCFIDSDHRSFADDGNAVALPIHFSGF